MTGQKKKDWPRRRKAAICPEVNSKLGSKKREKKRGKGEKREALDKLNAEGDAHKSAEV